MGMSINAKPVTACNERNQDNAGVVSSAQLRINMNGFRDQIQIQNPEPIQTFVERS